MEVTGPPSAYTSERVPFTVVVANEDDIEVNSVLHLDLQGLDRGDGERVPMRTVYGN